MYTYTYVIGFEKRAHLGAECRFLVGHTTLKYSSWASYCSLFCVCSCFHCWDTHIWKLRFVLLIYVHAKLFEPIAKIVALCEVGPFLKSYHIMHTFFLVRVEGPHPSGHLRQSAPSRARYVALALRQWGGAPGALDDCRWSWPACGHLDRKGGTDTRIHKKVPL